MPDSDRTYWGKLDHYDDEYGEQVLEKWREFQERLEHGGLANKLDRSWCQYHSRSRYGGGDTSEIDYSGDKGELVETQIAEFRSLIRTKLSLALEDELTFQALALNDDAASLSATTKAQAILRHYTARGGLGQSRKKAGEAALVMAASWIGVFWDSTAGEVEALTEDGDATFPGDVELEVFNLLQMAYDRSSRDVRDPKWAIVRRKVNRYELAKLHPKYEDEILDADSEFVSPFKAGGNFFEQDDDYIWAYYVFFKPGILNPVGRMSIVLPDGTVIFDGPSKYSRVPLSMLSPSIEVGDSGIPYGDEHDVLMLVELLQDAFSALSSQVDASTPILWTSGTVDYGELGPFAHLKGGEQKPETVHLFRPSEHLYQAIGLYRDTAARVSQVNQAMQGDPDASSSGSKTAFQVSTGMQQQKSFTLDLARVMEEVATMMIEVLRTHMDEDRVIAIAGKRGPGEVVKFSRADLKLVQSVQVKVADPMLDSPAGRQRMADIGAEKGWFNTPDEYVTAFVTGSMGVATGDNTDRTILIKRENEQLQEIIRGIPPELQEQANELIRGSQGQDVSQQVAQLLGDTLDPQQLPKVCASDNHREHIDQHILLKSDDSIRKNPLALHLVEAHELQHVMALTPGSPLFNYPILMATGQQPLPNTDAATGAPNTPPDGQPPGAEGMPEKPQGSPPKAPGMSGTIAGAAVPGRPPKLPSAPANPGSGNAAPTPGLEGAPVPPGATR